VKGYHNHLVRTGDAHNYTLLPGLDGALTGIVNNIILKMKKSPKGTCFKRPLKN
jgi:hypothetical protein